MADDTNLAPPSPTPPPPPAGALDTGVTGADPNNMAAPNSVMAEASRLGGPLGAAAIGAAAGASQSTQKGPQQLVKDPKFLSLDPEVQRAALIQMDPKFAALPPEVQKSAVEQLKPDVTDTTMPEVTQALGDQYLTPEAQLEANKKLAPITAGIIGAGVGGLVAGPAGAAAGGGIGGALVGGAAAGGLGTMVEQTLTGQNPFRLKNLQQTATNTMLGGAGGALLHGAGQAVNKILAPAEEALPGEVTEGMFKHAPEAPAPQHGVPATVEQPFDRATINNLPGGKGLSDEAVATMQNYTGDKILVGSTPKNTMMKAVAPVQEAITKTGLAMNKLIDEAPQFETSTIQDGISPTTNIPKTGEPIELNAYHATDTGGLKTSEGGTYFSPEPYKEYGNQVLNKKLSFKNPVVLGKSIDDASLGNLFEPEEVAKLRDVFTKQGYPAYDAELAKAAKAAGHDGIIFSDGKGGSEYVALTPETIKDNGSKILSDLQEVRENLPLREDDPLQKVVDKQVQAAYPALESTDPREILSMRRKLGNQIDWANITNTPTTAGEAADLTRAKIYNALSQKLKQIPGMDELDKVFRPNLELQSHFDAKLGKEVSRDAAEAASQQASEYAKGLRQNAVNAHNAKVDANIALAKKALGIIGLGTAAAVGGSAYEAHKLAGNQ